MAVRSPPKDSQDSGAESQDSDARLGSEEVFQKTAAWVGQLQGVYNASRSGDTGATLQSLAGSLVSSYGLAGTAGAAAAWATGVGAVVLAAYGMNRARAEERKEQRANAQRTIAEDSTDGQALPLVYGYFSMPLTPVYALAVDSIVPQGTLAQKHANWNWDGRAPIGFGKSIGNLPNYGGFFDGTLRGRQGQVPIMLSLIHI